MRRVISTVFASVLIALLVVVMAMPAISLVATASGHASAGHEIALTATQATIAPSVSNGPITVTPTINNLPLPTGAAAEGPFSLYFTVSYTNVNPAFAINAANATINVLAFNGTALVANNSVLSSTIVFVQVSNTSWSGTGVETITAAFLATGGDSVASLATFPLTFEVYGTAYSTNASLSSWAFSAASNTVTIPAVTGSVTGIGAPAGPVTVPFTVTYNFTSTGTAPGPTTATALVWYQNTTTLVTSDDVSAEIAPGQSNQTFTVDYTLLTSANFNNSVIPSGAYFFEIEASTADGWGISSGVTNASTTSPTQVTTFNLAVASFTTLPTYVPLPINLAWNLTSSIPISPTTINQTIQVVQLPTSFGLPSIPVVTLPVTTVAGQTSYTFTLTLAEFLSGNFTGNLTNPNLVPNAIYQIGIVVTGSSSTAGVRTATAVTHGFIFTVPPNGTVKAAQSSFGNVGNGIANVTITATYTGSYLLSANVTVTTASGAIAFSSGVLQNCPTTPGSPTVCTRVVSVTWVPGSGGAYTITLTLKNAANQTATATGTTTVNATGGAVVTTNHWTNSTLLNGLSPGAAAAILLVVGLIIGLLVALVLGRSMWATPKPEPAQPWQQTTTTSTHECSVCHQTFATDEELQEHAKTAHGMT